MRNHHTKSGTVGTHVPVHYHSNNQRHQILNIWISISWIENICGTNGILDCANQCYQCRGTYSSLKNVLQQHARANSITKLCHQEKTDTHVCGSSKLNAYSCLPEWIVVRLSSELSSSETKTNIFQIRVHVPWHNILRSGQNAVQKVRGKKKKNQQQKNKLQFF